jgi:Sulfotransferase domain
VLPNLFIVGAARAGTTSLHRYLAQHPDFCMSDPKELRLFQRDDWRERLPRYESHFTESPVRGESSPCYTQWPMRPNVPERIASVCPDARIVYIVREPFERIASEWANRWALGQREPFERRMLRWDPGDPIVCSSLYATQVERYMKRFDRVLVVDQADLRSKRDQTLAEVFSFLGVEPCRIETVEANGSRDRVARTRLGYPIWQRAAGPIVRRLPEPWRGPADRWAKRLLFAPVKTPRVSDRIRDAIRPVLAVEADRLRELTGRQFADWTV